MNLKFKSSIGIKFFAIILVSICVVAGISLVVLYNIEKSTLENKIKQRGDTALNDFIDSSHDSLEKGQRKTFQRVMNRIAQDENVEYTALYTRGNFMTYKSGLVTVGLPFSHKDDIFKNPNEKWYDKSNGTYMRSDWSTKDLDETPKAKKHIKKHKDNNKKCMDCHFMLDKNIKFTDNKAYQLQDMKSNFFYKIPVAKDCVVCHTNWKVGEFAGTLGVTLDNTKEIKEMEKNIFNTSAVVIAITVAILFVLFVILFFAFRKVRNALVDAISQVDVGVSEIQNASTSIAENASNLSGKTVSQTDIVTNVSQSVKDAYDSTNQNSQNAHQADNLSKEANKSALIGYEYIKELSDSMNGISESSTKIANIIKTIDEIAFQTNLLALNAAVEAARAGEHGLGFAVVADEVRNLAGRSATAAKETTAIIEESISQVKNGNAITVKTNEAFNDILQRSKITTQIIDQIAILSNEQNVEMDKIKQLLDILGQNTNELESSSEELAATTEELNAQSLVLKDSIENMTNSLGFYVQKGQF
jgi:methyl-accepting chemotaxis protein